MTDLVVREKGIIERLVTLELARVTERAAVCAARLRGRGDERAADQAAVDGMRRELNRLPIDGRIVIGEGERDLAPMLYVGERVGTRMGPTVDIAVDPLEGTTLCAKDMPGSIAVMALAEAGSLLHAPDVAMETIALGPGYPAEVVDLDMPPEENIRAVARAKGVRPDEITVCILDRPRHAGLIAACRAAGASLRLLADGDVAGMILTTGTGPKAVDLYIGTGGAPASVIAAGALRCVGGQIQGRLVLDAASRRRNAESAGFAAPRKYDASGLAAGDVVVACSGVTGGDLLDGVRFGRETIVTETLIYRSATGTVRRIRAEHRAIGKFKPD